MAAGRTSPVLSGRWDPAYEAQSLRIWQQSLGLYESHRYRAGAELFSAGTPTRDVFLLVHGVVGLYYAVPDKEQALFMLGYPGYLLTDFAPDPGATSPVSAVALTPCRAYRVSIQQLDEARRQNAVIASLFQHSMKVHISRLTTALAEMLCLSPAERLTQHLYELASVMGEVNPGYSDRVRPPLNDEQLAMLLGISLRHFKRVKKTLQVASRARIESKQVSIETC